MGPLNWRCGVRQWLRYMVIETGAVILLALILVVAVSVTFLSVVADTVIELVKRGYGVVRSSL